MPPVDPNTKLGILLSSPCHVGHNLNEAFVLFKTAERNGCQHATYWRGRAYLNGFGVKRDISLGFNLIQQAAGNNILRALFETAALHEEGCQDVIRKNHVIAIEYYKAITLREANDEEYVWSYATSHLGYNMDWQDTEGLIVNNVGTLFSWEFAGQAFLFGGAATMAVSTELGYYSSLLLLLPVIGIFIACLSIIMMIHTVFQNWKRREPLMKLYEAKLAAVESLVGPGTYLPLWLNLRYHALLAKCGEMLALSLACAFLIGWVYLLW
jgi:hypothetical protein